MEITAIITASLAFGGVGGASVAHASPPPAVYSSAASRVSDRPGDGAVTALWIDNTAQSTSVDVDVDSLRGVNGVSLLSGLSHLAPAEMADFAARYPRQIDAVLAAPPAPAAVTSWWEGLGGDARASLASAVPQLVGNLNGVPMVERGRANLSYLDRTLSTLDRKIAGTRKGASIAALTQQKAVLQQVAGALHGKGAGPARSLVLLDTTGGGRAAIALGNPDTADYVSYLVPGMNYSVHDQIVNWTATADALYREQKRVLREVKDANAGSGFGTVATIAWIGYEAPDLLSVGGLDRAERGAAFLEDSWLGLASSRGADQPFLSVFAHSYGSTVTLVALSHTSVQLDALVIVGSPGSAVQSARDLPVADGAVYVGEADWDPAVNSAFFGSDPGGASYGARSLGVSGATDRLTGAWLDGSWGHNEYFKPGSESLHNMALIGTGNAKLVTGSSE